MAVLAHLVSYNITWGATKKEVERSNFFIEVPRILKRFWLAFLISFACFGAMILFSIEALVGSDWVISGVYWAVIFPLGLVAGCHVLFPVSRYCVTVCGRALRIADDNGAFVGNRLC